MRRKREHRASRAGEPSPAAVVLAADRFAAADLALLGAVTALVVATPLVTSESTVHEGTAAPLHLLWALLLFAWAALLVLRPDPQIKWDWTSLAAAALIGWHTLSGIVATYTASGRQALNMTWQMLCYGVAALLLRQLLKTPGQCRALAAIMIAVAALLAVQGYYEYFISKPAALAAFQADPEKAYQELGINTPTQQEHFRWRVESKEPMATFALANSLAGLLAPWLVAVLGIALTTIQLRDWSRALPGALLLAAILGGCLLLTKSRTAVLAAGAGLVLLALYGRTSGWRLGWQLPLAAALAAIVIGLGIVAVGGLDVQVLSEAPTSVLYRLQYWRATAGIIAQHPLFGCGPGQFQEAYTAFKLPEASETPRDPHNFLLEIWSTAGTPALIALLAMAAALTIQLSRSPLGVEKPANAEEPSSLRGQYVAVVAGIVLAWPIGLIVGFPQEIVRIEQAGIAVPGIWLFGIPTTIVCLWLLDPWIRGGQLPTSHVLVALITLLVNLLAAGAISFPGVFLTAWILACISLANADAPVWTLKPKRGAALGLLAASGALAALCMRTEFSPVLSLSNRLADAEALIQSGRMERATAELRLAALDDPWSPTPQRLLAQAALQEWLVSRAPADWQQFVDAANKFQRLAPRHHATYTDRGHWLLRAWRTSGDADHLAGAIEAYRTAVVWYPGRALERVQFAWALHLAGRDDEAQAAADVAKRLDDRVPHRELKLDRQTVYDPPSSVPPTATPTRNAEQVLRELRTGNQLQSLLPPN